MSTNLRQLVAASLQTVALLPVHLKAPAAAVHAAELSAAGAADAVAAQVHGQLWAAAARQVGAAAFAGQRPTAAYSAVATAGCCRVPRQL